MTAVEASKKLHALASPEVAASSARFTVDRDRC